MITVFPDFDLRHNNTFRMDARCRRWIEYTDPNDLPAVFADSSLLKPKSIGAGISFSPKIMTGIFFIRE